MAALLTRDQFDLFKATYYRVLPEPKYDDIELYKLADLGWSTKTARNTTFYESWKEQADLIVRILNYVFKKIPSRR